MSIRTLLLLLPLVPIASAQCIQQPDGTWSCPQDRSAPRAQPTAMDIRIECPTARGSGTAVVRLANRGTGIVTNFHVVRGQSRITLRDASGQPAAGRLLLVDEANDLAIIATETHWPIVALGEDVALGAEVHFRAFDRGQQFRKYYGRVVSQYSQAGAADGYFATGQSIEGNSGGGVYAHGKLVGVVWGSPNGQTAFIRIGPVRRLIARIHSNLLPRSSRPSFPASPQPTPSVCDCEERWAALDAQLEKNIKRPTSNVEHRTPGGLLDGVSWGKIVAAAIGVSGPIGLGIAVAGGLLGRRIKRRRGLGGPREAPFPGHREDASERENALSME